VAACTNAVEQWYAHEYASDDAAPPPIAADGAAIIPEQHVELRQASRSFCDLLMEQGKAHQVGRAIIFVSHGWKYRLIDVVTALRAHVDKLKAGLRRARSLFVVRYLQRKSARWRVAPGGRLGHHL